jgi:orotidine-5'-phosphate decarboxylase
MKKKMLFVALDSLIKDPAGTIATAEVLANEVEGNFGFKVNVDYILKHGTDVLKAVTAIGKPVFTDIKMWNGGRTMSDYAKGLVDLGVDYFNIYALADKESEKVVKALEGTKTKLLMVSVLTHYDEAYCQRWFKRSLQETVHFCAEIAMQYKSNGIILPGTCLSAVEEFKELEKCVPGIRPAWFNDDRHSEEVTPSEAITGGADILVCGSPIFKSTNPPVEALKMIIKEMEAS